MYEMIFTMWSFIKYSSKQKIIKPDTIRSLASKSISACIYPNSLSGIL